MESRTEKKQLVAAYVQQRLVTECEKRGTASRIAEKTGFSTAHVANAKNYGTIGADFAEAMAAFWNLTTDELHAAARAWATKTKFAPARALLAAGSPLRALPSWPEAAKIASQMASAKDVDDVGGFVPPAPVSVVTPVALLDLVRAWTAMRAASAFDPGDGESPEDDALPLVVGAPESTKAKRALGDSQRDLSVGRSRATQPQKRHAPERELAERRVVRWQRAALVARHARPVRQHNGGRAMLEIGDAKKHHAERRDVARRDRLARLAARLTTHCRLWQQQRCGYSGGRQVDAVAREQVRRESTRERPVSDVWRRRRILVQTPRVTIYDEPRDATREHAGTRAPDHASDGSRRRLGQHVESVSYGARVVVCESVAPHDPRILARSAAW